jgi:hypothetical protein
MLDFNHRDKEHTGSTETEKMHVKNIEIDAFPNCLYWVLQHQKRLPERLDRKTNIRVCFPLKVSEVLKRHSQGYSAHPNGIPDLRNKPEKKEGTRMMHRNKPECG